jgi:hypothetical protein
LVKEYTEFRFPPQDQIVQNTIHLEDLPAVPNQEPAEGDNNNKQKVAFSKIISLVTTAN